MTAIQILGFATALGAGLIAGIFYAFSAFVMAALGRLAPEQGIAAMQSINVVVLNPLFLSVFMGTALASLALIVNAVTHWGDTRALYLAAGGILYIVGTFGVTAIFNVPLNNALAAAGPASAEGAQLWARYLQDWTGWNHLRTAASLAASASFMLALR